MKGGREVSRTESAVVISSRGNPYLDDSDGSGTLIMLCAMLSREKRDGSRVPAHVIHASRGEYVVGDGWHDGVYNQLTIA